MAVAAIVLAAGGGSRFNDSGGKGNKLLAPYLGRTVVEWAIEHAATAGLDATYVVVGATDVPLPPGVGVVRIVRNERWQQGLASSLQAGLRAAKRDRYGTVVVGLGDQPLVPAEAWRAVARTSAPIAVATYGGVRSNPVRLSSYVWPLLPTSGDEGARKVMRRRPDIVVEVPCPGSPTDIDTIDDLDTGGGPPSAAAAEGSAVADRGAPSEGRATAERSSASGESVRKVAGASAGSPADHGAADKGSAADRHPGGPLGDHPAVGDAGPLTDEPAWHGGSTAGERRRGGADEGGGAAAR